MWIMICMECVDAVEIRSLLIQYSFLSLSISITSVIQDTMRRYTLMALHSIQDCQPKYGVHKISIG